MAPLFGWRSVVLAKERRLLWLLNQYSNSVVPYNVEVCKPILHHYDDMTDSQQKCDNLYRLKKIKMNSIRLINMVQPRAVTVINILEQSE